MIEYYKMAFKKYAQFEGRSTRSEYWWFVLCNFLVAIALYAIVGLGLITEASILVTLGGGLVMLYALATLIPSLAIAVRRLHDTGKSGWFLLLSLIPLGGIVVLVFLCLKSDQGTNKWGPVSGDKAEGLQDSLVDFDNKDLV